MLMKKQKMTKEQIILGGRGCGNTLTGILHFLDTHEIPYDRTEILKAFGLEAEWIENEQEKKTSQDRN